MTADRITFQDYATQRIEFDRSPGTLWYYALGLAGETGEVVDKIKKVYRDKGGVVPNKDLKGLILELGDVLWYLAGIARYCSVPLDEVARLNIEKLTDRRDRSVLHGEGDKR